MRNINLIIVMVLVVGIVGAASTAHGQIRYGQPLAGSMRLIYTHWNVEKSIGEVSIGQFMIPVSGFVPLRDNLEARFFIANASNSLDLYGYDMDMSGLSDLRLQVSQSLAEDQLLVSLGANLPTGKNSLDKLEELPVMLLLSQDYLSFPIRRLGEGFGMNLVLGGALASGPSRFGASLTFQYNGAYESYKDGGDYDPGDMFSASVGADTKTGDLSLNGNLTFSTFTADQLEDAKIFRQSREFGIGAGAVLDRKKHSFAFDMRYLIRGRNTQYDVFSPDEAITDQLKIYGNEFAAQGSATWVTETKWSITPMVELRVIGENESDLGSSSVFGFGGGLTRSIGEGVDLDIGMKYYTGSADGGDIDLFGYQMSVGFAAAFK